MDFDMLFGILIFYPKWGFAGAIAFALWPIFKMVLFLEYLVFFGAVSCTEQLLKSCRIDFGMFFGILIFDPKRGVCMGYRLCIMADFQNGLISRIFSAFCSGFFHRTTVNDLCNGFWDVFLNFNFWPKVRILHGL